MKKWFFDAVFNGFGLKKKRPEYIGTLSVFYVFSIYNKLAPLVYTGGNNNCCNNRSVKIHIVLVYFVHRKVEDYFFKMQMFLDFYFEIFIKTFKWV